ncbi:phospholipase D delta [Tanacetum coccineum]|uniref:Phospholipase D delta n=1 Tax=Tanacetum coccineum TaxID=301880 RepID=A0ABQ5H0V1_9ASTR
MVPIYKVGTKASRQPWHDLHCKIDGHAAYDVLLNFEQKWRKATRWPEILVSGRMACSKVDKLLNIEQIPWILSPKYQIPTNGYHTVVPEDDPLLHMYNEDDLDSWHVQGSPKMWTLFRNRLVVEAFVHFNCEYDTQQYVPMMT